MKLSELRAELRALRFFADGLRKLECAGVVQYIREACAELVIQRVECQRDYYDAARGVYVSCGVYCGV